MPSGSWTTATRTAASPRCAATESVCSPATCIDKGSPQATSSPLPPGPAVARCAYTPAATSAWRWVPPVSSAPGTCGWAAAFTTAFGCLSAIPTWPACVDTPLDEFDLSVPPELDPGQFPAGANVELVRVTGRAAVRMRVRERGSGETRSCGTGAVAAAAAAAYAAHGGSQVAAAGANSAPLAATSVACGSGTAGVTDGSGVADGSGRLEWLAGLVRLVRLV